MWRRSSSLSDTVVHADVHGHVHAHVAHHPALQHHFESLSQQKEASTLGMWTFLLTEILFFGGLFMAYMLYRLWYHDAFVAASSSIVLFWGAFNTVVLIASSLTMALAVRAAQTSQHKALIGWLLATMFLGAVFLGVKVIEYADKFEHHHVPGPDFVWDSHAGAAGEGAAGAESARGAGSGERAAAGATHAETAAERDPALQQHTQIFFSLYFTMTGLHALHMIIGIGLMSVITFMAWQGKFDGHYYTPVEMSGLYWHFVDIVWIYLFPLLYLIDRS
jgi:cytochrome c oxidase subunit III